jgi:competence protein ComEA
MKKVNAVALILLALSIAMPTTFSMAAADQDTTTSQAITAKININSASLAQLQKLPGVGPVTASKIEAYRNENGAFSQVEELTKIKGIGSVTLEKMKPYITI